MVPIGITVNVTGTHIVVRGSKGELVRDIHRDIRLKTEGSSLIVEPASYSKKSPALWGLTRTLISNMIEGVSRGYQKYLEFEGVGFRAGLEGNSLTLQLGFSHPVIFSAPPGITFVVQKNVITVSGVDKELVGKIAAEVRALKPPEPYKGKGIRYQGEVIRRKAGKKAVASA